MNPNEIIKMACNGNGEAEAFCHAWVAFCHRLDDCVDKDKNMDAEEIVGQFTAFMVELAGNPFFQGHKGTLIGLMVQSANAWLDSMKIAPKTLNDDALCDLGVSATLKGFYHEVVFHCAYLCGGWKHLRRVTSECREYDWEIKPFVKVVKEAV